MWRLQWNWNWHTSTPGSFLLFRLCEKWAQLQFSRYVHSPNIEQMSLRGPSLLSTPFSLSAMAPISCLPESLEVGPRLPKVHPAAPPPGIGSGSYLLCLLSVQLVLPTHMRTKLIQLGLKKKNQFNEYLTMRRVPFRMERCVSHLSWLPGWMISRRRCTHVHGDIQNPW